MIHHSMYNQKAIREVYQALEDGIFRDATFGRDVTVTRNLTVLGNITFGDASFDNFIIKGRFSTMTAAGAAIDIDSDYTYNQLWEIRATLSDWSGFDDNFTGVYFRFASEADSSDTGSDTLTGMVVNISSTNSTGALQGLYVETQYKTITAAETIGKLQGIESNLSLYAQTETATLTTWGTCFYGTIGIAAGYTDANLAKLHGMVLETRDAAVGTEILGHGIYMVNKGEGTQTWTTGIYMNMGATTGISLNGAMTTGIDITGGETVATGIDIGNCTTGISFTGACTTGINFANGWTGKAIKIGTLSSTETGYGAVVDSTTMRSVEVNSTDADAARDSAVRGSAVYARLMIFAGVVNEDWAVDGLTKISSVLKTGNVTAGVMGRFETVDTCSLTAGSNAYFAGVIGRIGTGSAVALGDGSRAACILAFGNNLNSNAFSGDGKYVGVCVTHSAVITAALEDFDYGIEVMDSVAVTGINIGACTTGLKLTGTQSQSILFESYGASTSVTGLLMACGASSTPATTAVAGAKFFSFYTQTTATSGMTRSLYIRHRVNGSGMTGEALRAFMSLNGANLSVSGASLGLFITSSGSITGSCSGASTTLEIPDAACGTGHFYAACSIINMLGASSTMPANASAIHQFRVYGNATGAAKVLNAFHFDIADSSGDGEMYETGTSHGEVSATIRININGTTKYLGVYDAPG